MMENLFVDFVTRTKRFDPSTMYSKHFFSFIISKLLYDLGWDIFDPSQVDLDARRLPCLEFDEYSLALQEKGTPLAYIAMQPYVDCNTASEVLTTINNSKYLKNIPVIIFGYDELWIHADGDILKKKYEYSLSMHEILLQLKQGTLTKDSFKQFMSCFRHLY